MADDLKSMMTKVMTSKGTKKFFFAYGGGKRKDGKGDGEFAVSTKKVKKADIEGKLAAPKEVLEGTCWLGTGEDAGTVFLKGKSISGTAVSKMALTAKLLAGRQFDFQIPSPEEEARAEAIKDSEGEGEGKESSSEETAPQETPTEQPLDSKGRLAALKKRVDEVFAKNPEARKSKLLPTYQLAEHLVNSGKEDKAPEALDRLETALAAFDGAPSEGGDGKKEEGKKEETKPSGPEAAFQSRLKALQPEFEGRCHRHAGRHGSEAAHERSQAPRRAEEGFSIRDGRACRGGGAGQACAGQRTQGGWQVARKGSGRGVQGEAGGMDARHQDGHGEEQQGSHDRQGAGPGHVAVEARRRLRAGAGESHGGLHPRRRVGTDQVVPEEGREGGKGVGRRNGDSRSQEEGQI